MMKKVYYEKVGRKYVPVSVEDATVNSFQEGSHLVVSVPKNYTMYRYNIDPAFAPLVAAGCYARPAIESALVKASEMRPARALITEEQKEAWQKLSEVFGDELATLHGSSIAEIAQAGIDEMQTQAKKLLENPAVNRAYEQFLLVSKLAMESK